MAQEAYSFEAGRYAQTKGNNYLHELLATGELDHRIFQEIADLVLPHSVDSQADSQPDTYTAGGNKNAA